MKLTISEAAKLTGVSVRTLHYYDGIGLLKPDYVDEQNGYRYYSEKALERMQEILFYRELDFSLEQIGKLLSRSDYDRKRALRGQRELLELKRQRLDGLLDLLDTAIEGEEKMDFKAFDNTDYETARAQYAQETKERYGNTAAYKESAAKTAAYTGEKWAKISAEGDAVMNSFGELMKSGAAADSPQALELAKSWQDFITKNYYTCTAEILAGLAEMYVCDERFTANIDRFGSGTAAFMADAIRAYVAAV